MNSKVIVLSVNGLLCFEQYDRYTPWPLKTSNIVARPGLVEFFKILFRFFHVGIWSSMQPGRLRKVLEFLLPKRIRTRLLFVYGRNKCFYPQLYPFCNKLITRLFTDFKTKDVCLSDHILMVDDQQRRHAYNGDLACYFPKPWLGELALPNARNVIPNISTALLPYILKLRGYKSVRTFLQENPFDGKFRRRLLSPLHLKRIQYY
jgi:NLI interacting factor-like phosphatase